ncbi:MAG: DUF2452 domain-containing protein [Cyclobacteriaceae bacterium]|nr:DUF2452 domain-containing protein [Cyclobacteriaceae bacterium]
MTTGKKIDVDKIDLEELGEKAVENPGLVSFAHSIGGAAIKPTDVGKVKGRAMAAMQEQTDEQLKLLYEQMQTIARQAKEIKLRIRVSERIYLAKMGFEPIIGKVYFLYEKEQQEVLSMISPEEWGSRMPFDAWLASVKLRSDHTWEIIEAGDL